MVVCDARFRMALATRLLGLASVARGVLVVVERWRLSCEGRREVIENGKQASQIWWSNEHGDTSITASESVTLTFEEEFRGDHHLDFIVERHNGAVIAHHNLRFIATVKWKEGTK